MIVVIPRHVRFSSLCMYVTFIMTVLLLTTTLLIVILFIHALFLLLSLLTHTMFVCSLKMLNSPRSVLSSTVNGVVMVVIEGVFLPPAAA